MRSLRRAPWSIAAALLAACASAGAPPGGPERHTPPEIVAISPDSGETNVNIRRVEFRFDEVVREQPSGAGASLNSLFLISPWDGSAEVSWHRDRITLRPRKGFRANEAYRVTMLPGLADLRGNVRKTGATILFATGPTIPPFGIIGRAFDWEAQRPAAGAYIEATPLTDTTIAYITATDSAGQFDVGPLNAGTYRLRALLDQNGNRVLDRNEKWDTVTVTVAGTSPGGVELDAIERDTLPAAILNVTILDTVTMRVSFDKPLDPRVPLDPSAVRVQRSDSSDLRVTAVQWASAYDRAKAAADSARTAATDTTRRPPPAPATPPAAPPGGVPTPGGPRPAPPTPKPRSAAPDRAIVISIAPATPLVPGRYVVTSRGFPNLAGRAAPVRRGFTIAPPVVRDTTGRTPADTTRRPGTPPSRPPILR